MLQATVSRMSGFNGVERPVVVCNHEHRFFVAEQLRQQGVESNAIILEPVGRNTAPAVALAALSQSANEQDPVLLIMPADHVIKETAKFREAVTVGAEAANQGALVTFGVVPSEPNTGYGYIRARKGEASGVRGEVLPVDEFVEKPDLETARGYVDSGEYYWNSGIFMFKASAYLEELGRHAPDMLEACKAALTGSHADLDFTRLDEEAFKRSPSDSIDYAVMEKTEKAMVVPLDAGWSDVGSWHSLWEVGERDEADNVAVGDVLVEDTKGCYVLSEDRLVAAIGVENLVIVETGDAVLVMDRDRNQEVKKIVEYLKGNDRPEAIFHRRVPRPWGAYECIDVADRFQVKRITVKPGERLSLQMHHHRAEHWIVVTGTAKVTRGDEVFVVSENESTYIPLGVKHRLENPGKIPLELIEVQSGSYLGENDIVRFDDSYGR